MSAAPVINIVFTLAPGVDLAVKDIREIQFAEWGGRIWSVGNGPHAFTPEQTAALLAALQAYAAVGK